jgi:hypothetical protein
MSERFVATGSGVSPSEPGDRGVHPRAESQLDNVELLARRAKDALEVWLKGPSDSMSMHPATACFVDKETPPELLLWAATNQPEEHRDYGLAVARLQKGAFVVGRVCSDGSLFAYDINVPRSRISQGFGFSYDEGGAALGLRLSWRSFESIILHQEADGTLGGSYKGRALEVFSDMARPLDGIEIGKEFRPHFLHHIPSPEDK